MSTAWAIYGGRFDPFHHAHFAIAKYAVSDLPVSKVLVVPNGEPAHKQVSAAWSSRMRMCQLGLAGLVGTEISQLESPGEPRFACDTIAALEQQVDTQVWVVGADNFADINKWKEWRQVLSSVNWAVMLRSTTGDWRPRFSQAARLASAAQVETAAELATGKGKIWVWDKQVMDISANELRGQIVDKRPDWKDQVPQAVTRYIEDEGLYQQNSSI